MEDFSTDNRNEVYGDPGVHALSVAYFDNLKSGPQPHRACMELLTSPNPIDDNAKFICLEVIDEYIRNSYEEGSTVEAQEQMRNFLTRYGEVQLVTRRLEEVRVRAQVADIFARVCLVDYPSRWPEFFATLCLVAETGRKGCDHLVRTLRRLHNLILGRSKPEQEFDRLYGTVQSLQTRDFAKVLDVIARILDASSDVDVDLQKETMGTMGSWVSLIDPGVFTKHLAVDLVLSKLDNRDMQKPALSFLSDLMMAVDISVTDQAAFVGLVFQQLVALGLTEPKEATEKISTRVGSLLKETGSRMLDILVDQNQDIAHTDDGYTTNLNQCFKVCVEFLKNTNTDISSSVIQFFIQYIGLLLKHKKMSLIEYNHCIQLLDIILVNVKLRPTLSFKDESKNEAFANYRKSLVKLFEKIVAVKGKAVYKVIYNVILEQLVHKNWKKEPFPDAEYPIFLLNMLCFTFEAASSKSVGVLMKALMNSDLSLHPHSAVTTQFFQAVAKNIRFFKSESKFIPEVVAMFQKSLNDENARFRSISAEQLLRFLRGVGKLPTNTYADILRSVHKATFTPGTFKEAASFKEQNRRSLLSLVEVAGLALVRGRFTRQHKRHLVVEIIVPAMHLYHDGYNSWCADCNRNAAAEKICCAIDIVASLARTFDANTAATSGCDDVFVDTVSILDHLEQEQLTRSNIHASVTQLVYQMVSCLGDRFLPFLPRMLRGLLSCRKYSNIIEVAELLTFVVDKYKLKVLMFFKQEFIRCSSYIYESLTTFSMHNDHEKNMKSRQKLYLAFVSSLLDHGLLIDILAAVEKKAVARAISMIIRSTLEGPRGEWRIRGLAAINRLVDKWPRPGERNGEPSLLRSVAQHLVMGAFLAMKDTSEDQTDYCATFVHCAQLIQRLQTRCDEEFVLWLKNVYLPQLGVCQEICDKFLTMLSGENNVQFEEFLKSFFTQSPDIEISPLLASIPIPIEH